MIDFAGMTVVIIDAQKQARTVRDVRGSWVRPRCQSKKNGRRGTRRAWKRINSPGYTWLFREPTDVIVIGNKIILTPMQADLVRRNTV